MYGKVPFLFLFGIVRKRYCGISMPCVIKYAPRDVARVFNVDHRSDAMPFLMEEKIMMRMQKSLAVASPPSND